MRFTSLFYRTITIVAVWLGAYSHAVYADTWQQTLESAQGQRVYFNAWGGSADINAYIKWAGEEVKERYGVELIHVELDDTAVAVARVLAEKQAGKHDQGSIDLMWINGENFKTMKDNDLLFGNLPQRLPNYEWVDSFRLPTDIDFTVAVDGLEAPWGVAQFVFIYDKAVTSNPPKNTAQLLEYAQANPGRFAYPRPPQFHGTSFLKQILYEMVENQQVLMVPVEDVNFDSITQPLWEYLDALNAVAWRKGRAFPKDASQLLRLLNDGELDIAFTFNPQEVNTAIKAGQLPNTARAYSMNAGALTNVHFLAIPYNASANAGAQVVINFLMSPQAQARKASTDYWGDPSVLAIDRLDAQQRAYFGDQEPLFPGLSELHPSWQNALEDEWERRYGQ